MGKKIAAMPRRAALLLATAWTIALSCSSEVSGWLCGSYTCPVGFELRPNHADLRRCPMEYLQRSQCCTSEGWNHACCMHFTRCGNSSRQDDFGWAESCCENTEDPNICCVSTAPSTAPTPHTELDHLLRAPVLITSHQGLQLTASSGVVGLNGDTGNLQKWIMIDATNGKYFITSHQGLQLEDRNGVVGLNEDTGNLQKWTITDATDGTYFITSHQGFQLGAHMFWDKYRSEDVPRVHLTEIMGGDQKWTLSGSCETCDLVPCGYCQHGCEYSSCTEEDVGMTRRVQLVEMGVMNSMAFQTIGKYHQHAALARQPESAQQNQHQLQLQRRQHQQNRHQLQRRQHQQNRHQLQHQHQ